MSLNGQGRIRGVVSHASCTSAQVRRLGGGGGGGGRAYLNLSPAVNHAYRERHSNGPLRCAALPCLVQ